MNKTNAIKEAMRHGVITGRGRSWTVWGPYYCDRPSGPSTGIQRDSYAKAVVLRSKWRADIAISLMDLTHNDRETALMEIDYLASEPFGPHDVRGLVDAGLRAIERVKTRLAENAARAAAAA